MITVNSLIKRLEKFPKDTRIVVYGYEGGVDYASQVDEVEIALNVNNTSYEGKHEIVRENPWKDLSKYKKIKAIIIG